MKNLINNQTKPVLLALCACFIACAVDSSSNEINEQNEQENGDFSKSGLITSGNCNFTFDLEGQGDDNNDPPDTEIKISICFTPVFLGHDLRYYLPGVDGSMVSRGEGSAFTPRIAPAQISRGPSFGSSLRDQSCFKYSKSATYSFPRIWQGVREITENFRPHVPQVSYSDTVEMTSFIFYVEKYYFYPRYSTVVYSDEFSNVRIDNKDLCSQEAPGRAVKFERNL